MEYFDNEGLEKETLRGEARQQDFDDLQREVAGLEVGRVGRFLPEDMRNPEQSEKGKAARQAEMVTRLQMMMRDPAYAAAYNDTMNQLAEAERATEIALVKTLDRQRLADEALSDIRARALTLEDGRRVYRDEGDTFRTEDGSAISDFDADAIAEQWHPGMPGYRDFAESHDATQIEAAAVEEIITYQVDVLGSARDQVSDHDEPPNKTALERIDTAIENGMPPQVRAEIQAAPAGIPSYAPESTISVPKL